MFVCADLSISWVTWDWIKDWVNQSPVNQRWVNQSWVNQDRVTGWEHEGFEAEV